MVKGNQRAPEDTRWITINEVAKHLRLAPGTVKNWAGANRIPCHRVGRSVRFDLAEVEAWARGK